MSIFECCSAVDVCAEGEGRNTSAGAKKLRDGKVGVGVVVKARRGEDRLFVASMHPGGPADLCGRIFEGDELMAIDGVRTQGKTYEELADLMLGSLGTPVSLEFARGGRAVTVNLVRGRADEKAARGMQVVRSLAAQGQALKTKRFPKP